MLYYYYYYYYAPIYAHSSQVVSSFEVFYHDFARLPLFSHTCYMPYPSHLSSLYNQNNIWRSNCWYSMEHSNTQGLFFSSLLFLPPQQSSRNPFLRRFATFWHKVRHKVPRPQRTAISTVVFLKLCKCETGNQILNCMVASILLSVSTVNFFLDAIFVVSSRSDSQHITGAVIFTWR